MKLALECPTFMLSYIQPLADFDFILTHQVLRDKRYAEYYATSSRFKILDNSCNELLKPCSLEDIKRAAGVVRPNLIVAPDFLGDSKATLESLQTAVETFGFEKILPVVQGSTMPEVTKCFSVIGVMGFDRVAVPFDITCTRSSAIDLMATARREVVAWITSQTPIGFKIHLLGMNTLEELRYMSNKEVDTIDTGSPVLHGQKSILFGGETPLLSKAQPTLNQMDTLSKHRSETHYNGILYNIAYLRKIINGES